MKALLFVLMGLILLAITACVMPKNPNIPGFAEGYNAAVTYMLTEPMQPEEVNLYIRCGYQALKMTYRADEDPLDDQMHKRIVELYSDESAEFHEMVFRFYKMGRIKLEKAVIANNQVDQKKVIRNFIVGVEQALKEFNYIPKTEREIE